jgi:hypothetical protein
VIDRVQRVGDDEGGKRHSRGVVEHKRAAAGRRSSNGHCAWIRSDRSPNRLCPAVPTRHLPGPGHAQGRSSNCPRRPTLGLLPSLSEDFDVHDREMRATAIAARTRTQSDRSPTRPVEAPSSHHRLRHLGRVGCWCADMQCERCVDGSYTCRLHLGHDDNNSRQRDDQRQTHQADR